MAIQEIFREMPEKLQNAASVKMIYGEPVSAEGKTIITVAKVRYGFGGGFGEGKGMGAQASNGTDSEGMGGGGGGGVEVTPVGMIEITAGETRYVSFEDKRRLIKAVFFLILIGMFLFRRRRKRK